MTKIIQHSGYFHVQNAISRIKNYFNNVKGKEITKLEKQPGQLEKIDVILKDRHCEVEFDNFSINIETNKEFVEIEKLIGELEFLARRFLLNI